MAELSDVVGIVPWVTVACGGSVYARQVEILGAVNRSLDSAAPVT